MTNDEIDQLAKVLDLLRAKGVEFADLPDYTFRLRYEGAPVPVDQGSVMPADLDDAEKCACGCLREAEHNAQGLCIGKGCPVSLCMPEAKSREAT